MDLPQMRSSYNNPSVPILDDALPSTNPFEWFKLWYTEASDHPGIGHPGAMTLATCSPSGIPSCRMMILRYFDNNGFVFYTGTESQKGKVIDANPLAAMLFFWPIFHRQVRIEGSVERISREETACAFSKCPRDMQIAIAAVPQSQILTKAEIKLKHQETLDKFSNGEAVSLPEHWSGYRLVPQTFEFWVGSKYRLHDRIKFSKKVPDDVDKNLVHLGNHEWQYFRLAP